MSTTNPKNAIAIAFPEFADLENEDTISIDLVGVNQALGGIRINDCYTRLLIHDNVFQPADRLIDTIENIKNPANKYEVFLELYNIAKSKANGAVRYVTALEMSFGIDNHDRIRLLYRPAGLVKNHDISINEREYDANFTRDYYYYDNINHSFQVANNISVIKNYKDCIKIVEPGVGPRKYKLGDVTSVIFSFQEIFAVLYDNTGNTISIFNAIENEIQEDGSIVFKHSLLLAPQGLTPPFMLDKNLLGMYADLAHLCPPHCIKFTYVIE